MTCEGAACPTVVERLGRRALGWVKTDHRRRQVGMVAHREVVAARRTGATDRRTTGRGDIARLRVRIHGAAQGAGFPPWAYRLARQLAF